MTAPLIQRPVSTKAQALQGQIPLICTALAGSGMLNVALDLRDEFSFFEFRLDTLEDPAGSMAQLQSVLQERGEVLAIATCRRKQNGGQFAGSAEQEAHVLLHASQAGAQILDLSVESAEELSSTGSPLLAALRECPSALLISWHDFTRTPDLQHVYARMHALQPDFYKIVPTAANLRDSLTLLGFLREHGGDENLIAMSMGIPGVATRILGPYNGSRFTFGSAEVGKETAPGQVSSRTLRDLYRLPEINGNTNVYGVFGKPVSGSKSPVMLNTAFRATGRNAVYLPLEVENADDLFECMEGLHLAGASVTMPLKEQIVARLASLSDLAKQYGAANTLVRREDGLRGENTDAVGILNPLEDRLPLDAATVLVLGAGGAARAAVYALRSRGAQVFLCNRTHQKAEELARLTGSTALRAENLPAKHFDVILNATPYGMANQQIVPPIQAEQMSCRFFFDMVYNPVETPLIGMARARGAAIVYGTEMFVTQGAAQFELWTNKPAPVDAMRDAVIESLQA